jgi:hypothetical protein
VLVRLFAKRLMGLEPTTFCMAIVLTFRVHAWFCGSRVNPITGDYRGFGVYWSPNGHRLNVERRGRLDPRGSTTGRHRSYAGSWLSLRIRLSNMGAGT